MLDEYPIGGVTFKQIEPGILFDLYPLGLRNIQSDIRLGGLGDPFITGRLKNCCCVDVYNQLSPRLLGCFEY